VPVTTVDDRAGTVVAEARGMKLRNLEPLVLSAILFTAACAGDEPSIATLATNVCTCDEQLGEPWTAEDRTACRNAITTYLSAQPDSCLDCLDSNIGDGTEPAACAMVDTCTTCGSME